jgi:hypothetical protein
MTPHQAADGGLVDALAVQLRMTRKPDIWSVWLFPSMYLAGPAGGRFTTVCSVLMVQFEQGCG